MTETFKFPKHLGPKGLSLLKGMWDFAHTPLEFSLKCAQEYGDVVDLSIGSNKFYIFNHPSLIEEVLSRHQNSIKDYSYRALENVLGNGLLLSHGNTWKYHRRLMQSAFNRDRLNNYAAEIVADTELMLNTWRSGEIRDVHQEMSLLTVKVIMRAMFGIDAINTAAEITQALNTVMVQYFHQAESFFLLPTWLPTKANWQANRAKRKLNRIVNAMVEQRRLLVEDDLLSTMLSAKDEAGNSLSHQELRDQVATLLLAGYDTTANALTWTLMLLAQNPEVEAKLVAEIKSIIGDHLLTIDDLPQLPYTEMVLKESMRLYPPAWILGRELTDDCNIGGSNFTRGTVIYFSQWSVHRDTRYFNNPEQFNPDRWLNLEQHLPRCAYFPFGAGARVCIGKAFSMMEATVVLAMVIQKFSLTLALERPVELMPSFTLRPRHGVKMAITSRE